MSLGYTSGGFGFPFRTFNAVTLRGGGGETRGGSPPPSAVPERNLGHPVEDARIVFAGALIFAVGQATGNGAEFTSCPVEPKPGPASRSGMTPSSSRSEEHLSILGRFVGEGRLVPRRVSSLALTPSQLPGEPKRCPKGSHHPCINPMGSGYSGIPMGGKAHAKRRTGRFRGVS